MKQPNKQNKTIKRSAIEILAVATIIGLLYITGLHTQVLGTLQRAVLWTGLFDAERTEVETSEGPFLSTDAYNFQLTDADGRRIRLGELKGKVLFVNVWASWCPPCVAEMPTIESLYSELADNENIRFLMISLDEKREKAMNFMEGKEFTLPYHFPAYPLPAVLRSSYIPTTYVISKEGQIIYKKEGIADYSSSGFRDWLVELSE